MVSPDSRPIGVVPVETCGPHIQSSYPVLVCLGRSLWLAKNRLARIGFDRVVGYIQAPLQVLLDNMDKVTPASRLSAADFTQRQESIAGLQVVDVRNPGEVSVGTIGDAIAIPVGQLPTRLGELDPAAPTVVFCAGGYRSSVAAKRVATSRLQRCFGSARRIRRMGRTGPRDGMTNAARYQGRSRHHPWDARQRSELMAQHRCWFRVGGLCPE